MEISPLLTLNLRVKVQTLFDDFYEGTVCAYDTVTNTVTICTSSSASSASGTSTPNNSAVLSGNPADYRILKISFLRDVTVLSTAGPPQQPANSSPQTGKGPFSNAEPKIAPVNISTVEARERAAVRKEIEKITQKGVDVTQEAQEIFDALSRTYVT